MTSRSPLGLSHALSPLRSCSGSARASATTPRHRRAAPSGSSATAWRRLPSDSAKWQRDGDRRGKDCHTRLNGDAPSPPAPTGALLRSRDDSRDHDACDGQPSDCAAHSEARDAPPPGRALTGDVTCRFGGDVARYFWPSFLVRSGLHMRRHCAPPVSGSTVVNRQGH